MKTPVQYQVCALRNTCIIEIPIIKFRMTSIYSVSYSTCCTVFLVFFFFFLLKDKSYVVAGGTWALLEHCPDPVM